MASIGGMWAPAAIRVLRQAIGSTASVSKVLRAKLSAASQLQPIAIRSAAGTGRHPIHPAALLRQQRRGGQGSASRWYSNHSNNARNIFRKFFSGTATSSTPRANRAEFFNWKTARAVLQSTGRAPFASCLRPNLTCGALPRTAGGYALSGSGRIGGARYFSHTPTAHAQVVQNVSQAVRAFWLSGQRARFDGCGPDGRSRYRAVSAAQDEASRKVTAAASSAFGRIVPGSYVDFSVNPTITALSPLAAAFPYAAKSIGQLASPTLNEEGFLDILSQDFERALSDLAAVMTDLRRLAGLGDLPILLPLGKSGTIRVRFPGVDAGTVERLCEDVGVERGIVGQDKDFEEAIEPIVPDASVGLRFPFAPDCGPEKTLTSPGGSLRSHGSELSSPFEDDDSFVERFVEDNPWLWSTDSGGSVIGEYQLFERSDNNSLSNPVVSNHWQQQQPLGDFEGLEGIYRFIQECDRASGRV